MLRLAVLGIAGLFFTSSVVTDTVKSYPEKLSDWQIYEGNMSDMLPAKGWVPYSLNTPLYSDYAEKSRLIRLPSGVSVKYVKEGVPDFPDGTCLVKTFYYSADFRNPGKNKNIIETRLLIKEAGNWKALTYVWNEQQTDAVLEIAGDDKPVRFIDAEGKQQQVRYVIPNQNQCKGCHNFNEKIMPIGPSVAQLNRNFGYASGNENQLSYWKSHKLMVNIPPLTAIPKSAVWNDTSADLNARARAYLAVNCAHCHRREGPAQTSGLFLTENEKDQTALGINKSPVAAGKGSGGRMVDILPGNATASIFWYRMQTQDPGERMPELGRNLIHKEGVALIKEWIDRMK